MRGPGSDWEAAFCFPNILVHERGIHGAASWGSCCSVNWPKHAPSGNFFLLPTGSLTSTVSSKKPEHIFRPKLQADLEESPEEEVKGRKARRVCPPWYGVGVRHGTVCLLCVCRSRGG